eukprot:117710-Hanusia_phi.AAC.1
MEHRRLVVATSMSSRPKAYIDEDDEKQLQVHNVVSWVLDEYLEAVRYDGLYQLVEPFLDVGKSAAMGIKTVNESKSREERVRQ